MLKTKIIVVTLFIIFCAPAFANAQTEIILDPSDLPKEDAFKAIVKIKTYILSPDYKVTHYSSGSGVIVDSSGLVLTNHHVVHAEEAFDSSEVETGYAVCLTNYIDEEPDCSYSGRLIAKNEDIDIALLQIENIPGYSFENDFDYLDINSNGTAEVNDEVIALGYPGIGGNTVTITKGIVSGRTSKYDIDWIKTDTVTSFGSSGGAVIDTEGKIIGITTQAHSDMLGTLGYLIDMASAYDWYIANKSGEARASSIEERVNSFTKLKNSVIENSEFRSSFPAFSITKPTGWDFSMNDENALMIDDGSDDDGGVVTLVFGRYPKVVEGGMMKYVAMRAFRTMGVLAMVSIIKDEDIEINGNKARAITVSAMGEQQKVYYISVGQYIIEINYDYGKENKDKASIESIIESINIYPEEETVLDPRIYVHDMPVFSISALGSWSFLKMNSKEHPLFFTYNPVVEAFFDMELDETNENTVDLNNEEYLEILKQNIKDANTLSSMLNYKAEIASTDAHYKLNDELNDVIMIDYTGNSVSDDEILVQNRIYYIKSGDKYIVPSLNYFSSSDSGYTEILNKFNELMTTMSFTNNPNAVANIAEPTPVAVDNQDPEPVAITENQSGNQIRNRNMYDRLRGKIMIKVEDAGKAYYINPSSESMHYLGRPEDAFAVMREQGVGINTDNLEKIPLGLSNLSGPDADGDGLPDIFEDAIGTDKNNKDTDSDGYNDRDELEGDYSPRVKSERMNYDNGFAGGQKGKIFLQVEGSGEAWYINPADSKRYFLGRPSDAFNVMRNLGLGITNTDFNSL